MSGRRLGEFVLRERIGEGGFGAVYRCEQPALGREAVVKILHHKLRDNDVVVQRFLREAQLASRIDHPYSAHVYAFNVEDDGMCWIAMEMVHGITLDRWFKASGLLTLEQLVPLFDRIAEVVETAHTRGIVHRDLKPANIMVMERAGRLLPKLLDLGIAKIIDDAQVPVVDVTEETPAVDTAIRTSLTLTNAMLGSPPYMAPEQWADPLTVGPPADLYALAIIAYECLTGRRPFEADTVTEYVQLHATAPVPPLGPSFAPALDAFFARALAKKPEDRPANAMALADALRTAATTTEDTVKPPPKRRGLLAIGLAIGVVAAGGVVAYALTRSPVATPPVPVAQAPIDAQLIGATPDTAPPPEPAMKVKLRIESTPPDADVYRVPSQIKVGKTPWEGELDKTEGTAVFAIKRSGYRDGKAEIDLRFGATVRIPLVPVSAPPPPPPPHHGETRHKGDTVDPFQK